MHALCGVGAEGGQERTAPSPPVHVPACHGIGPGAHASLTYHSLLTPPQKHNIDLAFALLLHLMVHLTRQSKSSSCIQLQH